MPYLRLIINTAVALIVLLLAALGARHMIRTKPGVPQRPPSRLVAKVLAPPIQPLRDYRVQIVGFGSARPKIRVDVTPQVAGEVIHKHERFFSGERITAGQVLFKIDPTDYELTRDRAHNEILLLDAKLQGLAVSERNLQELLKIEDDRLELAKTDLERAEELVRRGAGTRTEIDRAQETVLGRRLQIQLLKQKLEEIPPQRLELKAQQSVSRVQKRQAETDLARTIYRSPFDGRVIDCPLEVGEHVQAGQACGAIYATDVMEVPVPLPAGDMDWIGQTTQAATAITAEVVWQASPASRPRRWAGRVSRVEAGLAAQTRTATVIVKVINPPADAGEAILDINMFCRVTIDGLTLAEVFLLPRRAIQPDGSVYVITDVKPTDAATQPAGEAAKLVGRLTRRPVRVIRYTDGEAMILPDGGLAAGDRVVLDYLPKPVIGMAVHPVDRRQDTDQAAQTQPTPHED
ncbi:hypothetical protein LCGC14_0017840 [marine sediment metagenome]|uniref:Multidrug resistance protein MdtA-like barrel-sandwich hybrid domain-containing protein n=1 Tax=marine sediment metagenome TaxID=412755 RepID=A0A0F9Z2I2_9ZZZZ